MAIWGMIESRDVMLFISYSGGAKELDLIIPRSGR
ncbi:phosphosugar binding protein [Salmonella enterica subsp. enterica]|uniref:Phosphosugar binding protein n=1 Tax=Salmonella enterica I TaxID=59201 RepID=A0A3S4K7K7_SALET|nr:phosphosugar binding protein [Salmonella enterica subsp. enterica]